jgi:hypothetical protein
MNKPLKILRFAALALTVVTALGIGHAWAGAANDVSGALHQLFGFECLYCR